MKLNNVISWSELSRGYDWILCDNLHSVDLDVEYQNGEYHDEETDEYMEVFQTYIVSDSGAKFIMDHCPDVVVGYSELLDVYFVDVGHFGTPWTHVYTAYMPVYDWDISGYRFATEEELAAD